MDPALQILKSGRFAFAIKRDDFSVKNERRGALARPFFERRDDLRKLIRLFIAEPRPEPRAPARASGNLDDGSDAVVLWFVDQLRVVERRVGERRQHGS